MTDIVEKVRKAMHAKRRELIAVPLDRTFDDLARAALRVIAQEMKELTPEMTDYIAENAFAFGLVEDPEIIHRVWNAGVITSPLGPFIGGNE